MPKFGQKPARSLGSVTFEPLCTPNFMQNIKKCNEPIQRKVGYGRTDGQTDGRTDSTEFIGPSGYAGGPKIQDKLRYIHHLRFHVPIHQRQSNYTTNG